MRSLPAVLGDAVAVAVFVAIGRSTHHHVVGLAGMASTSWPFLAGLLVGWLAVGVARSRGRRLGLLGTGLVVWPATVALGMALRVLAGQGTAVAFAFVALAFLGLFLIGWRLAAVMARALRRRPAGGRATP